MDRDSPAVKQRESHQAGPLASLEPWQPHCCGCLQHLLLPGKGLLFASGCKLIHVVALQRSPCDTWKGHPWKGYQVLAQAAREAVESPSLELFKTWRCGA